MRDERTNDRDGPDDGATGGRAPGPGGQVGLGRVLDDRRPDAPAPLDPEVEAASAQSFPASDPPAYAATPATPGARPGSPREAGLPAVEPPAADGDDEPGPDAA